MLMREVACDTCQCRPVPCEFCAGTLEKTARYENCTVLGCKILQAKNMLFHLRTSITKFRTERKLKWKVRMSDPKK